MGVLLEAFLGVFGVFYGSRTMAYVDSLVLQLIIILQSHLQALYSVIILTFMIVMSLFPGALVQVVGKYVKNINHKENVGQGGGSIVTPK